MYQPFRKEYYQYRKMLQSCFRPRYPGYRLIGTFGISVFADWLEPRYGFKKFLEHIGPMPEDGCQLDRKNIHSDFVPGNVFWRVPEKQIDLEETIRRTA